jgi:hypothetical protein
MLISATMDLSDLCERMGHYATIEQAEKFRHVLAVCYGGMDTTDVPEARWESLMEESCN